MSPENRREAGLPQGRGAPRSRRAPDAYVRSAYTVRPLNGRPVKREMRLTFSKFARARAIACARVALRVCDEFIRCLTRRPSYLKYYFKSKDPFKRTRVRLHAWSGACSPTLGEPRFSPVRRRCRTCGMHLRCLYGFMRCKVIPCISSIVCSRYMLVNYSNCPVSWCIPVGRAGVRTLNPCLMVRKDTNSKSK